jgi:hypothetical protein
VQKDQRRNESFLSTLIGRILPACGFLRSAALVIAADLRLETQQKFSLADGGSFVTNDWSSHLIPACLMRLSEKLLLPTTSGLNGNIRRLSLF